jgi:two-component system response regulator
MKQRLNILMADDDADDRALARDAMLDSAVPHVLQFVEDGEQLLAFLRHQAPWPRDSSRPAVILLDLNMPRMNGREVLAALKADPRLRQIPVVVVSTSAASEDIFSSYDLGANSYVVKPETYEALVDTFRTLATYWLDAVELPPDADAA